jgi:hypothetical protein
MGDVSSLDGWDGMRWIIGNLARDMFKSLMSRCECGAAGRGGADDLR